MKNVLFLNRFIGFGYEMNQLMYVLKHQSTRSCHKCGDSYTSTHYHSETNRYSDIPIYGYKDIPIQKILRSSNIMKVRYLTSLILAIIIMFINVKNIGAQKKCFTNYLSDRIENRFTNPYTCCTNPNGFFKIPVAIHVFAAPVEDVVFPTNEYIATMIDKANEFLAPHFELVPIHDETNCSSITFRPTQKICCMSTGPSGDELQIKDLSRKDPNLVLNIWIIRDVFMPNGQPGLGFAYLPQDSPASNLDGIVLAKSDAPSKMAETLVHEFGHYMGLLHVWGRNEFSTTNCNNSDPCFDGDEISDTEPCLGTLPNSSFGVIINADCSYTQEHVDLIIANNQQNPYCAAPGTYPCNNIMSGESLATNITNGQFCRMIESLSLFRSNLGAYQDICIPCNSLCLNDCYIGIPIVFPGNLAICDPCYKGEKDNILVTGDYTLAKVEINGKITVKNGGKMLISNSHHNFAKNSEIIVEAGGQLTIDNAQLNNCFLFPEDKWNGINSKGKVILKNQGLVANAIVGIENNGGYFSLKNAGIQNCDIGLLQNLQNSKNNEIDHMNFQNCITGIEVKDNKNFSILNSNFTCESGVVSKNSAINVHNSDFNCNSIGVELISPLPNFQGSTITGSRFLNSSSTDGINIEGSANLNPHLIQGNFFGNDKTGIWALGNSTFDVRNNDFYSDYGVRTWDNGIDLSQMVLNNTFASRINGGEAVGYNDTEYNDNCFDYSQEAYIHVNGASSINENQGDFGPLSVEAGNCFSTGLSMNIVASNGGLSSFGPSVPFNYHIWEETPFASCKDPKAGQSYNTSWTLLKDSDEQATSIICGSGQWTTSLLQKYRNCIIPASLVEKKKMEASIRTELKNLNTLDIPSKLRTWIRNRLLRCLKLLQGQMLIQIIQEQNKQVAITMLDSFPSFHNKILAYSLLLEDRNITLARTYLNAISDTTIEALDFKITQNIYLDYLANVNNYKLGQADRSILYQVGIKHNEYSSFARSIYYLLTGNKILPDLSRIDNSRSYIGSELSLLKDVSKSTIRVFPNPVSGKQLHIDINIAIADAILEAKIYDIYGKQIIATTLLDGQNTVDLSNIYNGIFILKIEYRNKLLKVQKIILDK